MKIISIVIESTLYLKMFLYVIIKNDRFLYYINKDNSIKHFYCMQISLHNFKMVLLIKKQKMVLFLNESEH